MDGIGLVVCRGFRCVDDGGRVRWPVRQSLRRAQAGWCLVEDGSMPRGADFLAESARALNFLEGGCNSWAAIGSNTLQSLNRKKKPVLHCIVHIMHYASNRQTKIIRLPRCSSFFSSQDYSPSFLGTHARRYQSLGRYFVCRTFVPRVYRCFLLAATPSSTVFSLVAVSSQHVCSTTVRLLFGKKIYQARLDI